MFVVSELKDIVRIPANVSIPRHAVITDEINKKYANRILHQVGLCIRVFDIQDATIGTVFACQDGSFSSQVLFRLIVFRPWVGEVLQGTIAASSEKGIKVSLDFFQDIWVPATWLKEDSEYLVEEGVWVWNVEGEEGEKVKMYMDQGEPVRCRVESLVFNEVGPSSQKKPSALMNGQPQSNPNPNPAGSNETGEGNVHDSPFYLLCSMNDAGLGCISWWEE